MTTSDDEPVTEEQDAAVLPGDDLDTMHAEPMDDLDEALAAPAAGGRKRWVLAVLAVIATIAAGALAWGIVWDWQNQEYVGVSVVMGLVIGWLMRVITKRTDLVVRVIAAVFTAVGIVVGAVFGKAWSIATAEPVNIRGVVIKPPAFWDTLKDEIPDWWNILTDPAREEVFTYAIFAAALLLAYLSAGPQSSGKKKARTEPSSDELLDEPVYDPLAESGDPEVPAAAAADDDEDEKS